MAGSHVKLEVMTNRCGHRGIDDGRQTKTPPMLPLPADGRLWLIMHDHGHGQPHLPQARDSGENSVLKVGAQTHTPLDGVQEENHNDVGGQVDDECKAGPGHRCR